MWMIWTIVRLQEQTSEPRAGSVAVAKDFDEHLVG